MTGWVLLARTALVYRDDRLTLFESSQIDLTCDLNGSDSTACVRSLTRTIDQIDHAARE